LVNYRYFYLCSFIFIITFLSSTATFCSNLTSVEDKDTPCFLEKPSQNSLVLRSAGNSLVLPCHVARSKRSTVEWWYTDFRKLTHTKIYPVYPAVRPTVLRFITSLTPYSKNANESDIIDASILLRHVNVDDSGIYSCVIRPWTMDPSEYAENIIFSDDANPSKLSYHLELTGPRLCQPDSGPLPCFSAMRTSSPTILDAYQTAFLQCVVKNQNRPANVFWVVGDASVNSVLITDFLTTNQYNGDRLRRVFPLSPQDYSIELSVNPQVHERSYSCVIEGATDTETTLFTYIIRTNNIKDVSHKTLNETRHGEKIAAQDALNREQILSLRENEKDVNNEEISSGEELHEIDEDEEHEETSTPI